MGVDKLANLKSVFASNMNSQKPGEATASKSRKRRRRQESRDLLS